MTASWLCAGALAVLSGILGVWLFRVRAELGALRARLATATGELERLERAFARFVPEGVVERIIASGIPTVGEKKEVTVLFADLVGFTTLSERVEPVVLVRILNGYFERMASVIQSYHGHISTLLGDGVLALFGALEPNPWQANDAAHTALAMRAALVAYNRELTAEGLPTLAFGIGLHRGNAVAGLVGSHELLQFTVVGTIVNVAARVQALTRERGVDILLTHEVQRVLDPRFELRPLPASELKGVSAPVATFALIRHASGEGGA